MDTQNKAWAEDKSKFGFKMLEKMGWTEGKGLGKNEDGVTTHVRPKRRLNTRGIGTEVSAASAWKAPGEVASSFNDVLARIGGAVESNDSAEASAEEAESAEVPSPALKKNGFLSRRRRGKDVRTYSDADLKAIFGGVDLARPPTASSKKQLAGGVEKKSKGKKKSKSKKVKKLE